MAPAVAPIRDLLTSFSPSSDFLALSSGDSHIKVWDAMRGHLQTEFADIPAVEVGALSETKRGHLALDYTCMNWVQLSSKKKMEAGSSLLVLGTGSGDVLAIDVATGQLKWRISGYHHGGVTAVAYSRHGRSVYTAGADGSVCKIDPTDGSVAGKFKSLSKAISALAVSSDGTILATAAGQLRTFDAADNKEIQKFSGHKVAVRSMTFSDNGEYVLSSGVGEHYVAIWKLGSGKTQSSSCILSLEHPAIFVDCKCSGINANEGDIHVLAISEVGICYFWSGNSMDDLRNKKPTKIALSESSLSRTRQNFAIFAAKLQGIDGPNSAHVLLAYGSVVKPSFYKLLVCYGKDANLGVSEDGVLLPTIQPTMPQKGQSAKTKGTITALDRANAEDAILPFPKLHTQEKKRKHGVAKPSGDNQEEEETDETVFGKYEEPTMQKSHLDFSKAKLDFVYDMASPSIVTLSWPGVSDLKYCTGFIVESNPENSVIAFHSSVMDEESIKLCYSNGDVVGMDIIQKLEGENMVIVRATSLGSQRKAVTFGDNDPNMACQQVATIMTSGRSNVIFKGNIISHHCETHKNRKIDPAGKDIFAFKCPLAPEYPIKKVKEEEHAPKEDTEEVRKAKEQKEKVAEAFAVWKSSIHAKLLGAPVFDMNGHLIGMVDSWAETDYVVKFARKAKCFRDAYNKLDGKETLQRRTK